MAKDEEPIDLDKLTVRELLIVCAKDVRELKADMKSVTERQHKTEIKVSNLETKSKTWGAVMGFLAGLGTIFFERAIK